MIPPGVAVPTPVTAAGLTQQCTAEGDGRVAADPTPPVVAPSGLCNSSACALGTVNEEVSAAAHGGVLSSADESTLSTLREAHNGEGSLATEGHTTHEVLTDAPGDIDGCTDPTAAACNPQAPCSVSCGPGPLQWGRNALGYQFVRWVSGPGAAPVQPGDEVVVSTSRGPEAAHVAAAAVSDPDHQYYGRVKVQFADGKTYHVRPTRIVRVCGDWQRTVLLCGDTNQYRDVARSQVAFRILPGQRYR